jgi:hypothetical protein
MANDKDFVVKNAVEISKDRKGTVGTVTASDVDLSTGGYFVDTLAANTTYTFSSPGTVQTFLMEITGASTFAITWPASVQWAGGSAPTVPAAGQTDVLSFTTGDGGTTYLGLLLADNIS